MHVLEISASLIRLGLLPLKYILSRLSQLAKQYSPNEVTDEGIMMEIKPLQLLKQPPSNEVTDEGIVIEVKQRQNMKHLSPKLVKELGIVMLVKLLQLSYLLLVDYQYYTL